MLSCCFNQPNQLTVGTSCGTIALLPIQIKRFISLRRINPSSAKAGFKFLAFCIVSNFILNVLAIFKIGAVDWISHLGCLVTGFVFLVYFWINEKHENHPSDIKTQHFAVKYLKYCPIIILSIFCTLMGVIIWVYLPYRKIGQAEL
jgi:formate hydrogenlyase subunit 3/multisubunit Na+/H+ antiporter MnhD subunit